MNEANSTSPAISVTETPGFVQPSTGCSINANEIPARPLAASAAPVQSIGTGSALSAVRASRAGWAGIPSRPITTAAITIGTLIRKIHRHDAMSTISPPSTGPARIPIPPQAVHLPIAPPRSSLGKTETMIASAAGVSIAPETPCRARATISTPIVGDSAHSAEPIPKPLTPAMNTRRSPSRSVSDPASRISADSVSR